MNHKHTLNQLEGMLLDVKASMPMMKKHGFEDKVKSDITSLEFKIKNF